MKKTLAALAVLGAFAGSAAAADVTLYGVVDQAFSYTYSDIKGHDGLKAKDGENTFEMASGINAGSRFGLKGKEDLGNGWSVGFKLENAVSTDDGTLGQNGRLFGLEAALTVYGPFGELAFGRMGGIGSSMGTYDLLGYVDAFEGGDNAVWGFDASSRYDNMVTYATPRFAGLQAVVQYSFKTSTKGEDATEQAKLDKQKEGRSTAERYASFGLSGEYGPAQFAIGYELTKYSTLEDRDDHHMVFAGGNYDFGAAKLFVEGQYFKGAKNAFGVDGFDDMKFVSEKGVKGYGLHLGTIVPVAAGELTVGAYYVDATVEAEGSAEDRDGSYYALAARYCYPLSTRTTVYVGGGYGEAKADALSTEKEDAKAKIGNLYLGLTHTF